MTATFFLGVWLFVSPAHGVLHDRVVFDHVEPVPPNTTGVESPIVTGWDSSQEIPAAAAVIDSPAEPLIILSGTVYCQALEVRHVHKDRVAGVTEFFDPACNFPLIDKRFPFHGVRK